MTTAVDFKAAARAAAFARRAEAFAGGQGQAAEILADFLAGHRGRVLSGYMPMRSEIDPLPAMAAHQGPVGVPVGVPVGGRGGVFVGGGEVGVGDVVSWVMIGVTVTFTVVGAGLVTLGAAGGATTVDDTAGTGASELGGCCPELAKVNAEAAPPTTTTAAAAAAAALLGCSLIRAGNLTLKKASTPVLVPR